jgi:hypothetical protein
MLVAFSVSGEHRPLACSIRQLAEYVFAKSARMSDAVRGKLPRTYRLAACAPQTTEVNHLGYNSSIKRGRAMTAGSRTTRVANCESDVFSGFTSMS